MKRVSMNNARMHRFVLAHLLTVVGEWAAIVGILVHAYRWGGSSAVGFVALAVHVPTLVFAPLAAHLTARHRAHSVRLAGSRCRPWPWPELPSLLRSTFPRPQLPHSWCSGSARSTHCDRPVQCCCPPSHGPPRSSSAATYECRTATASAD